MWKSSTNEFVQSHIDLTGRGGNKIKRAFLSLTSLDHSSIAELEERFSGKENSFLSIHALKLLGVKKLLSILFDLGKQREVYLVFNDLNYRILEHFVQSISLLIPKFRICRVLPDLTVQSVFPWGRLYSAFVVVFSSFRSMLLLNSLKRKTFSYSDKRITRLDEKSLLVYLKTNLSFGTKAGGSFGHISGVCNQFSSRMPVKYLSAEEPMMIDAEVTKHRLDIGAVNYSFPFEANPLKVNCELIRSAEKVIADNKPNCIYSRLTLYNFTSAFLSNKYRIPLIVEYNGSEVWVQANWSSGLKYQRIALKIEDYVLKSADLVVTVSDVNRDDLLGRGISSEKIVNYPNCIDPTYYNPNRFSLPQKESTRKDLGFSGEDLVFTFIGTFGMWHGVEFLAESIVRLVDHHSDFLDRKNVKFLIIGDGLLGDRVRDMLCCKPYERYVTFTGLVPQTEAPRYLAASDAFVSPHIRQEGKFIGSPTKLFEYMAFAKPIIASNLDQVGEIFEAKLDAGKLPSDLPFVSDESAIIFEPNSHSQFIASILFLAENYQKLGALGENAHALVMKKYTWSKHVDKIVEKYNCLQKPEHS